MRRLTAQAGDSFLHHANPTVKFTAVFVVSAVLLAIWDPITPAILYIAALITAVTLGRLPLRTLAAAQVPFLLFAVSLLAVNALTRPGDVLIGWGALQVTVEGLYTGTALGLRTLVIGVCSVTFVLTTDPVRLMTSLHQQAKLPARITYGLLAGYRLLGILPGEWATIRRAHAVREVGRRPGQLSRSPRTLAAAAFTLLVGALRRGERMAMALESRGLGAGPRTVWRPVTVTRADRLFLAGVCLAVATTIASVAILTP